MEGLSQTLLTLGGYPLSLLELLGVLSGLLAVLLASKALSVNFLVGMFNSVCYFLLFFQYRLYSVMLLQVVYFTFSLYGFYHWRHPKQGEAGPDNEQRIRLLDNRQRLFYASLIALAGVVWAWLVIHFQARFPAWVDPPAYPWLDAFLAMASVFGQWLLSKKYWENWVVWLMVDVSSTLLYASMGMVFTAIMYGVFSMIALKALISWFRTYKSYHQAVAPVTLEQ
ncbi:MAG: Nicotinamide riboside transporter PnuC [Bacteroidetes bacterium ADurb.Bin416]|jgi:nicotinamide mononucleotide transporter|nr:MAG: Nicotinamide riboside transporter PnuC [Bacteroidetes bacterium ADurb.Bin416]